MRRSASAIAWSGIEAGCAAALSVASALLVARIIGPAELGIGAAVVSVHVLLWVVVNALFGDALVQRAEVDATVLSSALLGLGRHRLRGHGAAGRIRLAAGAAAG